MPALLAAQDVAEQWQRRLRDIGRDLLAEQYEAAETSVAELAAEMTATIVGGRGTDLLLAMAATYRALAVAGQGRGDEAVWYWQVAQQLYPRVEELDLNRFGAMGTFLSMHPPRKLPQQATSRSPRQGEFTPPVRIESPRPEFPDGRAFRGLNVDVVVQVVVGVDGRPSEPLILESRGEHTLVWATLEALRQWRFEPGRWNGEAESTLYKLTATYVVPEG